MNKKPKIVLDTNVLLVSISSKSEMHWIFQKLLQEEFELVVSNEILLEYEEVISRKYSVEVATAVIRTLLFDFISIHSLISLFPTKQSYSQQI